MKKLRTAMLGIAFALALPAVAPAQGTATPPAAPVKPKPKAESQAALARQANVSLDSATVLALKVVPGATIKAHELEREGGKLIYSFELRVAGKSGIEEVNINAKTGLQVGKTEHEADPAPKKPPAKKP